MSYRIFFIAATCILLTGGNAFSVPKDGHAIKVKIIGLKDTVCYLAGYYGGKQYYKDTARVDATGNALFKGDEDLPGGIYSIVLPDKKTYFEFVVNEQFFSIETDTSDFVNHMKFKGSDENDLFYNYLRFIAEKQKVAEPLREAFKKEKKDSKEYNKIKTQLGEIDQEVKDYKIKFMEDNPEMLMTKVFKTSRDPEVPETPLLPSGKKDSLFPYRYFKAHYFDGVDFSDERLLRTPVLHTKIEYFIKKLTVQHPDSINASADYLAEKAKDNKEIFKYVVHYITNTYEKSKIMGMDAVFVHMADRYYLTGQAFWMDSTQIEKVRERATTLKPLLIGKKVPNIILPDTSGNWQNLHLVKAKYTVLYFWDPNCGHCKKATPKLKDFYEEYRDQGVEVFAVGNEFENDDWIKYIRKNNLKWINVSDNPEINKNAAQYLHITTINSLNFRDIFDIFSTPVVFLLDENKTIIAKRIGVEQLADFIDKKNEGSKKSN